MNKSDAGKLGAMHTKIIRKVKSEKLQSDYLSNPCLCKCCNNILDFKKRKNLFCSSSCSTKFNNTNRETKLKTWLCLHCDKPNTKERVGKFCNNTCQHAYYFNISISNWLSGNIKLGNSKIKKYLTTISGYKCATCGISKWNNKKIVLELEHKDGNSENNEINNLCLICPNCHSQTDTYKGRNKGNGRHYRRIRYNTNKSY